jgi:hypothetical protein
MAQTLLVRQPSGKSADPAMLKLRAATTISLLYVVYPYKCLID